jgi:V-type H+-transporting ATPase subunit d
MEMATFAFDSGFADAIVRGLRSGFLTQAHYSQIANLGSLAELKSFLEDTDYGPYLINDGPNLPVSVLRSRLKRKVAEEIEYVKLNGCGKMAEFINRLLIRYQIDNVVNLIEGIKNKVDMGLLMASIDPLGYFP